MSPLLGFLTVVIPSLLIAKGDLHTCNLYRLKDRIAHILNRAGLGEMLVIGGIDFALTVWTKAGITAWQPHLHGIVWCPMGLAEAEALLSQHLKGTVLVARPVDLQPITWNLPSVAGYTLKAFYQQRIPYISEQTNEPCVRHVPLPPWASRELAMYLDSVPVSARRFLKGVPRGSYGLGKL